MPEGPEIRLAADRIAKVLVGDELVETYFAFPKLKRFEKQLTGTTVDAIDTRGKAMLTRFSNGLTMYSHNQLYGRWYTTRGDKLPNTKRSLRVALHTETHSAWLFSASDVDVLTAKQLDKHPFLNRVGPDILDPTLTPARVRERLKASQFCRRSFGALYLDQAFLAGIGNYLRSEILFTAGVHPASRPADLDDATLLKLGRETLKLSRRSYRTRGLTVTDSMARQAKAEGLTYGQYRFWVFGREGKECLTCGSTIERTSVGSRGLFLCNRCQPLIQTGT
ncbi:MAG: endonuclease VIII [Pseudomonadota bacterium]